MFDLLRKKEWTLTSLKFLINEALDFLLSENLKKLFLEFSTKENVSELKTLNYKNIQKKQSWATSTKFWIFLGPGVSQLWNTKFITRHVELWIFSRQIFRLNHKEWLTFIFPSITLMSHAKLSKKHSSYFIAVLSLGVDFFHSSFIYFISSSTLYMSV